MIGIALIIFKRLDFFDNEILENCASFANISKNGLVLITY